MQRVPGRIKPRRNIPRHRLIKYTKIEVKDKILKATRGKWQIIHKVTPIKLSADFSTEILQFRREWHLKWWKFSSVQALSCVWLCNPMDCSTWGLPVHHQLPELVQMHIYQVGDAIQPSHPICPLLLLPLILPSIRVFSNESALHIRWPKY